MSLTRKVSIIVLLVFIMSALASFAIQQKVIMPSFVALEKETATRNAERALAAIKRELDQISPSVSDWANWTDTYTYVKGQNPDYAGENLDDVATLEGLNMNFMGIYNLAGKSVWTRAMNLETGDIVDLGPLSGAELPVDHPLLQLKGPKSVVSGIIPTSQAPLLVVAKPILKNDHSGPTVGTFVLGRFLDDAAVERIGNLIKLPIIVTTSNQQANSSSLAESVPVNQGLVYSELKHIETPLNWEISTTISDLFGNSIMNLQVNTSRDISAQGAAAVKQSLLVLVVTGLLMMLILWKLLQQAILKPIKKLTEHAIHIGENDNSQVHLDLKRTDEVGVLAQTFNQMVDSLAETRHRLIDQSYHSGIAEMASGVLHNIGNAITPLNIRLATLQQELGNAPLAEMEIAATELADPATPPDRRTDLEQFVTLAGDEMASLINNSQEKVDASIQQVVQIQEILNDQQRFSRSARVIEPVEMATVIGDMAAGLSPELQAELQIEIAPSVAEIGTVSGARAALQQVVTNLLINAAESIQSAGTEAGKITVTAEHEEYQGQPMIGLRFVDNGAGIDPDHLGRIFEQKFSTKNRENSGYGLHWSANTVQALGGQISAESSGLGSGACIHVLLPPGDKQAQSSTTADKAHNGI